MTDEKNLENVGNLCIIDCPLEELKSLKTAKDVFVCSSDENQKIDLKAFY